MKKLFILLLLSIPCLSSNANQGYEPLELSVNIIDQGPLKGSHKAPHRIPSIYIDGHTLFFPSNHSGYLIIISQDDEIIFYSSVLEGVTQFELPYYLNGEYDIQFYTENYIYSSFINL